MKIRIVIIVSASIFLTILLLTSCKKEPALFLSIDKVSLQLTAQAADTVLHISSNTNWKLSVASGADFLMVDKASGTGDGVVKLNVSQNLAIPSRTATLRLEAIDASIAPVTILIEQKIFGYSELIISGAYGGSNIEYASRIRKVADGQIMIGETYSNDGDVGPTKGNYDMWIVKTDNEGNILWSRTIGGNRLEAGFSIAQTKDGGYMAVGYTASNDLPFNGTSFHGGVDLLVVKLSSSGTVQWQKVFGGSGDDIAQSITATPDGYFLVAGSTSSIDGDLSGLGVHEDSYDMWLLKLKEDGNIQWQKTHGGSLSDRAYAADISSDGYFVLPAKGLEDICVFKLGILRVRYNGKTASGAAVLTRLLRL